MPVDLVARLAPSAGAAPALCLIEEPHARIGGVRRALPTGGRRVLALLALHHGRPERRSVAGSLWPVGGDRRAAGNLRSALWRLRVAGIELLDVEDGWLALRSDVLVDVRLASDWALRMIQGRPCPGDLRGTEWQSAALDLLPGWYDDWVVFERERLRQRLLHGMEAMSRILVEVGRPAEAVDAALATVAVDPLRESAQCRLAEAHLACGNRRAAMACVERYRDLLWRELGVHPGPRLVDIVAGRHSA